MRTLSSGTQPMTEHHSYYVSKRSLTDRWRRSIHKFQTLYKDIATLACHWPLKNITYHLRLPKICIVSFCWFFFTTQILAVVQVILEC